MSYTINIERRARRELAAFQPPILPRIIDAIDSLATRPRPAGCKKLAGSRDEWRIRVGDYRILYVIDDPRKQINIYAIGHRREVYR